MPASPAAFINDLNDKYRRGVAGHSLLTAGVLLHQFDTIDAYDASKSNGPSWVLSTEGRIWSDRVSAVLINEQLRNAHSVNPLYSDATAGIVFDAQYVDVLCSYSSDGGSQHVKCNPPGLSDTCTPGCSDKPVGPRAASKCWWGEREVGAMLRQQLAIAGRGAEQRYNEIILDAIELRKNLPRAIAAVFFVGVDSSEHCRSANHWAKAYGHCENFARSAHRDFLRRYSMSAEQVPLLRLDVHAKVDNPFSLADDPWSDPIQVRDGEIVHTVCLTALRATNVYGSAAACRPRLWVYDGQGNTDTVQKTRPTLASRSPRWDGESICVTLTPRTDRRVCFDIRDAGAPPANMAEGGGGDDDQGDLLHFGCTTVTARSVGKHFDAVLDEFSIDHKPHASIHFDVTRNGVN